MEARVPYSDHDTSRAAAESMRAHVGKQDAAILAAVQAAQDAGRGGMTAEEVSLSLGMRINSVTARINGLRYEQGKLTALGEKRRGTSGREHTVYCIATDGTVAPKARTKGRVPPTVAAERERVLVALEQELEARGMQLFREQLVEGVRERLRT